MWGKNRKIHTQWHEAPLSGFVCSSYLLKNVRKMKDMLKFLDEKAAEHPGQHLLATLDDTYQAEYTSGHAIFKHDLDETDGHDLSGLPDECFEDGEHVGSLRTIHEFPIRLKNLLTLSERLRFDTLEKYHSWWPDDGDHPNTQEEHDHDEWTRREIVTVNSRPDFVFMMGGANRINHVFVVPVSKACDAVAAFPNGYWASAYQPDELHCICSHFEEKYGLKLFGIGAYTFGLRKSRKLSNPEIESAVRDIQSLYDSFRENGEAFVFERLCNHLRSSEIILIQYDTG